MKYAAGVLVGVILARYLQHARWARKLTWWAFTLDVRRTDPHIYRRRP